MFIFCWIGWHWWESRKKQAMNPKKVWNYRKCTRCGIERHHISWDIIKLSDLPSPTGSGDVIKLKATIEEKQK